MYQLSIIFSIIFSINRQNSDFGAQFDNLSRTTDHTELYWEFLKGCFCGGSNEEAVNLHLTPYLEVSNLSHKDPKGHPSQAKEESQVKMAALGSALLSSLGLTQAERAFRPWWDAIEDHIVYTIIILVCCILNQIVVLGLQLSKLSAPPRPFYDLTTFWKISLSFNEKQKQDSHEEAFQRS